jgi:uncharacterized protein YcbK (DUF882 family)
VLENLAIKGVKRILEDPEPDIETVKIYHPEVISNYYNLSQRFPPHSYWITSGYRDQTIDAKNSPHFYAIALDIHVGSILRQIAWGFHAIEDKLFTRIGLYPEEKIVHLDLCDKEWMNKYSGSSYWVKKKGEYRGFENFQDAAKYSLE